MAVLITGGYGHIGSWTARILAEQGHQVIIVDINTHPPSYLQEVRDKTTFLQCDVTTFPEIYEIIHAHAANLEGIIHTAAIMGEFVQARPYRNIQLNINGFLNILEASRIAGVKKVVYTSTGAVYGEIEGIADEEKHPPRPADLYSATKASSEYLGLQYAKLFELDIRIARVYFVYGPGKLPSTFVQIYKNAFGALEGLSNLYMGRGGDQKADFTYVEDAAAGLALLFHAEKTEHQIYNIATGTAISVDEVAKHCESQSKFNVVNYRGPGKLMPRCETLSIDRFSTEFNFSVKVDIVEGIRRYADWIAKNY